MIAPDNIDSDLIRVALARFDKARAIDNACLPPVIAVVGAFSRGKSALINALIGLPLLPVHPLPTTALPTRLIYSETIKAAIAYPDGERQIAADLVTELTLANAAASPLPGAIEIRLGCPSPLLASGLVLLDTPGIDAPGSAPPVLADDVAALIAVFSADPPLSAEEIAFFSQMTEQVPLVFWVQTRIDRLSAADLQAATAFNQMAIADGTPAVHEPIPMLSVSVTADSGLDELVRALAVYSVDDLRKMRYAQHLASARDSARPTLTHLNQETHRLNAMRDQLTAAETTLEGDLEEIRAGILATLAHLSDYVLGNLSETIYRTDPVALGGSRGLDLADDQLRRVRDQLLNEVERAMLSVRQTVFDALNGPLQPPDDFPALSQLSLPAPTRQTVPIRVSTRRRLRPKQLDTEQTVKAYRTAVAHMCDAYAAELAPILEGAIDGWQAQIGGWFTDQRTAIGPIWRQLTNWAAELAAWF